MDAGLHQGRIKHAFRVAERSVNLCKEGILGDLWRCLDTHQSLHRNEIPNR